MIPPQDPSQITVKAVLFNTKVITVAMIVGLIVVTVAMALVGFVLFNDGIFKNEPLIGTVLIIIGSALWAIATLAAYFIPNFLFARAKRRLSSEGGPSFSFPAGGDVESLQQALDTLDPETRTMLLGNYLSGVVIRLALFEAPALLNAIFFLLTGSLIHLLLIGITLILMTMLFPTLARLRQWLENVSAT
jgi:hypothetical protein